MISIVIEEQNIPVMYWEWTDIIPGWEEYGKAVWNRWFLRWTFK